MSDELLSKLRADLRDAENAALLAVTDVTDGGSCCLDTAFLNVGSTCTFKRKSKALSEALGGAEYVRSGWWRGYMLRVGAGYGQASRRTLGVEAAVALLKGRGWDVVTFYRVD